MKVSTSGVAKLAGIIKLYLVNYHNKLSHTEPKVKDLFIMGVVSQLAAKWETVAYILDYDTPKIDNIKTSKRENPEKCCQELLRDWVEDKHDDNLKTWFLLLNTIAEDETFPRFIEKILEKLEKKYAITN